MMYLIFVVLHVSLTGELYPNPNPNPKSGSFYIYILQFFNLNTCVRYYYFRFLRTNGRHIEIQFPVSILSFSSSSACDSAPTTKFYPN